MFYRWNRLDLLVMLIGSCHRRIVGPSRRAEALGRVEMTPYDAWRTNVEDTNAELWEDAVEEVACQFSKDTGALGELVQAVAAADDVLKWLTNTVDIPQHHVHALKDLIQMAAAVRKDVELEMTEYRRNQR